MIDSTSEVLGYLRSGLADLVCEGFVSEGEAVAVSEAFSEKPDVLERLQDVIDYSRRDCTGINPIMFDIRSGKIKELK